MRKFLVNVNGTSYEVEVEEISGSAQSAVNAAKPAPASAPASALAKPEPVRSAGNVSTISAPMPGSIVAVNVKAGDVIKSGQVLLVLEAMKMENEILAPRDGRIVAVNASKGATVNSGDALISFE